MTDPDPLENLLPSLFQCFSVIFIGYMAVRLSFITTEAKALGTYVTKFALPALFFRSMATMNFYDVNWFFILAVSLGKLILFVITVLFSLLITKPINFGMAGILSMFITQSNDVALGYPILLSLFPELAKYIYLFAPTQLVFINPLCFILLEWHEYRTTHVVNGLHTSLNWRILLVLKNVLLNPLVYMTVIGVIFNFILFHHLPAIIDKTLQIFADSFSGVALFYLGMNMVDKLSNITKNGIYILVFILLGKLIFLPFLTHELVVHLVGFQLSDNQTLNYSLMGFFYGGLPTAPPVFLIASDFGILSDVIATGLVIGTFLSGPLMFITGRVLTMVITSKHQYENILQSTSISASTLSIFGCIWVLVVFILSRRLKSPVHRVTICYSICVLLSCLGLVIGRIFLPNTTNNANSTPGLGNYLQFAIFFIGCTGARLWSCLIALSLAMVKRKSSYFLMEKLNYFYIFGFSVPIVITSFILIFANKEKITDIDPPFHYGRTQVICSITVLAFSIISTVLLLILQVRFGFLNQVSTSSTEQMLIESDTNSKNNDEEYNKMLNNNENQAETVASDGDVSRLSLTHYCDNRNFEPVDIYDTLNDEFQIHRHIVLLIVLVVSMGFGFFLCLWRLINDVYTGIYIELEFLDCVFNFGQGFILWAIFGLDTKLIVIPFRKRLVRLYRSFQEIYIRKDKIVISEACQIRNQFCSYHLDNCRHEISHNISQFLIQSESSFSSRVVTQYT